jgi:hypothetical protein
MLELSTTVDVELNLREEETAIHMPLIHALGSTLLLLDAFFIF